MTTAYPIANPAENKNRFRLAGNSGNGARMKHTPNKVVVTPGVWENMSMEYLNARPVAPKISAPSADSILLAFNNRPAQ